MAWHILYWMCQASHPFVNILPTVQKHGFRITRLDILYSLPT